MICLFIEIIEMISEYLLTLILLLFYFTVFYFISFFFFRFKSVHTGSPLSALNQHNNRQSRVKNNTQSYTKGIIKDVQYKTTHESTSQINACQKKQVKWKCQYQKHKCLTGSLRKTFCLT